MTPKCGEFLESGKDKEMSLPLGPPEGTQYCGPI